MAYRLTIQQFGDQIVVEDRETILEAVLREGLDYPFDCRSGVCGECKCALVSGSIEMSPYLDVALEEDERLQGFILGCRSTLRSDCEIALLDRDEDPTPAYRKAAALVLSVDRVTHDIAIVKLETTDGKPFEFAPGQYADVRFAGYPSRSYSFANIPGSSLLEFHVRSTPGGAVSPHIYSTLKPGDQATVSGPRGMAYLRKRHPGPFVFCAGGSGLAPIASMVRSLASSNSTVNGRVFIGVRTEADVYLENEVSSLSEKLGWQAPEIVLSQENAEPVRRRGFLADAVKQEFASAAGMKAYLCGPPIMIETCRAALFSLGLQRQDCHADAFWTPPS
ncbi:2Fe-2S iron-sulfur cluster-binding protein [Mesorhizobium sp.]|uniref:2Fe-2S iron-sulfur cluster-binding protein n=1 Tax=Mesorhizobium sp. TaxID=1871066 RepID=UPI0025E6016B|nr:2Fe-2S iron-sulfur cluster-binding protein [Mesorhizobium sp.]